jgi:hypothetical protein
MNPSESIPNTHEAGKESIPKPMDMIGIVEAAGYR